VFMDWSDALTAFLNEQDGRESPDTLSEPFAGVEAGKRWHICRQFDDEAAGACVFWLASSAINNDDGTVPAPGLQQDVAVARIQAFTQWCVEAFNARNKVITSCYRGVGQFIGGLPGLPLMGGWPAVVDLCRSAATEEDTNGCLQAAYRIGAQFDPTLAGACEAWAGLPEKQEQCDLIATIRQAK